MTQSHYVRNLVFTIETGGDDVRLQSDVIAEVVCRQTTYSQSLNNLANWPNWTTNIAILEIQQADQVTFNDIQTITIHFIPGSSGPFDTGDNWNMQSIDVTYVLDDGSEGTLIHKAGDPLVRFTGSTKDWTGFP
jgi:hypothetical protein